MRRVAAAILILTLLSGVARAADPDVVLGILEESPAVYAHSPTFFKVRLAFIRRSDKWAAVCTKDFCPPETVPDPTRQPVWHVGFSGKYLGSVSAPPHAAQPEWVIEGRAVPRVGKPSAQYGGFLDSTVHRPLVVSSRRQFGDPDGWKKGAPPAASTAALKAAFWKKFPQVENCKSRSDEYARPWKYTDENIKLTKYYTSRNGWAVAELLLSPYSCDGPEDDAFTRQWFAISPEGGIKFLDAGIWLVDAGDYDGDGKSELIFAIDRYNEGGYILFYDDFARRATVDFHYH